MENLYLLQIGVYYYAFAKSHLPLEVLKDNPQIINKDTLFDVKFDHKTMETIVKELSIDNKQIKIRIDNIIDFKTPLSFEIKKYGIVEVKTIYEYKIEEIKEKPNTIKTYKVLSLENNELKWEVEQGE